MTDHTKRNTFLKEKKRGGWAEKRKKDKNEADK